MKAKSFQELFFNGLFGRLFVRSEEAEMEREFLLQHQRGELWCPSRMYLLLPVDTLNSEGENWKINWSGLDSCVSAVEFLMRKSLLSSVDCDKGKISIVEPKNSSTIHFANCLVDMNNLKDMVVLAIHTGRFYSVVEVVANKSAECPFSYNGAVPSDITTYVEYFKEKYGIVLIHPGQPLLRLKQSHNSHNLLVNFSGVSPSGATVQEKEQVHAYMPPEILIRIDVPVDVLKSFYLLPSLMHRIESLMLASQLRREINFNTDIFQIPSALILEALTTLKCCENFSMERLELLGDSVLKYAVSCSLFLKYPEKHEGKLTSWRSCLISNSSLHKFGTDRKLQEYILDSAFEPRRWVAPGQICIFPVPCRCGVDTFEVPLDEKFVANDPAVKVGRLCDRGHRWMCSKTIADCVEALIGAYYVGGGLTAALHIMKWLGINVGLDPSLVSEAITRASLRSYVPKADEISTLELKLGHAFTTKGLLQEAITHASQQELGVGYCYQRLEFLGDSVLGLLITRHLYESNPDIDPGKLTDLRSAAVSNDCFGLACVRRNLQSYLLHCSGFLQSQVTEFVGSLALAENNKRSKLQKSIKAPKALGDMVESIAGAMLIDTKLNLEQVWKIFEPLLSPIVTPDNLELPSLRKLNELCDSLGYFIRETCIKQGQMVHAELRLQLEDVLLIGRGCEQSRKAAKGVAAQCLLDELKKKKISSFNCISKRRKHDSDDIGISSSSDMVIKTGKEPTGEDSSGKGKQRIIESHHPAVSTETSLREKNYPREASVTSCTTPVVASIDMKKGAARTLIFGICKKLQWPMPIFKTKETKYRTPVEFDESSGKRTGFNSFVSRIILHIPNSGIVECTGDPRADKKSSYDSASHAMLHELGHQGTIVIENPASSNAAI